MAVCFGWLILADAILMSGEVYVKIYFIIYNIITQSNFLVMDTLSSAVISYSILCNVHTLYYEYFISYPRATKQSFKWCNFKIVLFFFFFSLKIAK